MAAFLREQNTLSLSTVDEAGAPWVTPLFYIADADLKLYWLSSEKSLHSRNIAHHANVSGAVYRHADSWRQIRGVQVRGHAAVILDQEQRAGLVKLYCARFELGALFRAAISQTTLYCFAPQFVRYIDNSKRFGYRFEFTVGSDAEAATPD